jgi:hypothetical protein
MDLIISIKLTMASCKQDHITYILQFFSSANSLDVAWQDTEQVQSQHVRCRRLSSISNWDNSKTLLRTVDYDFQGGKESKGNLERMVFLLLNLKISLTKYSECQCLGTTVKSKLLI